MIRRSSSRRGDRLLLGAPASARSEVGETLIELMVTILVMGTAVVAVLGAILTMVRTSDTHRRSVRAGNEATTIAEKIDSAPYLSCTTNPNYYPPTGYVSPSNTMIVSVNRKDLASRTATTPVFPGAGNTACAGPDQGAQQITVKVKFGTGAQSIEESVVLVKRKP